MTIRMHKKVKITVLRTEYYQELAEQYAIPNLGKCPFHQKGQVLYSDGINPPDGMCGGCLAGDCSHGMSAILGGISSAIWVLG